MKGKHFIIGRLAVFLSVALFLVQGGSCTLPARGTEPASGVTEMSCCVFPVAFSFLGAGGLAFAVSLMPY